MASPFGAHSNSSPAKRSSEDRFRRSRRARRDLLRLRTRRRPGPQPIRRRLPCETTVDSTATPFGQLTGLLPTSGPEFLACPHRDRRGRRPHRRRSGSPANAWLLRGPFGARRPPASGARSVVGFTSPRSQPEHRPLQLVVRLDVTGRFGASGLPSRFGRSLAGTDLSQLRDLPCYRPPCRAGSFLISLGASRCAAGVGRFAAHQPVHRPGGCRAWVPGTGKETGGAPKIDSTLPVWSVFAVIVRTSDVPSTGRAIPKRLKRGARADERVPVRRAYRTRRALAIV